MKILKLSKDTDIKPFESKDKDLNDFLVSDAKNYTDALLAVTYLIEEGDSVLLISLCLMTGF